MKKCPICDRRFSDDLSFCLEDGTGLVTAGVSLEYPGETPTVVASGSRYGEMPTVVGSGFQQQPPAARSGSSIYIWLVPLILLLCGGSALGGFLLYRFTSTPGPAAANNSNSTIVDNRTASPSPTVKASPTSSPSASPTPIASNKPSPTPQPTATPTPALKSYPATTRLVFSRGAVSTSYSGDLNPNGRRSFVLKCLSGQRLTASVSSSGNCVSFAGGGMSYSTFTFSGDNSLTVTNSCSNVTSFRISITVL